MKVLRIIISVIFLILGGFVLSSIVRAVLGAEEQPGYFLWRSYSYIAFVIPILLFWFFSAVFTGKPFLYRVVFPVFALAPFFVFSIALRTMLWKSPQPQPPFWNIAQSFGTTPAVVFWFFLGSLLLVAIAVFYTSWVDTVIEEKQTKEEVVRVKNKVSELYKKFVKGVKSQTYKDQETQDNFAEQGVYSRSNTHPTYVETQKTPIYVNNSSFQETPQGMYEGALDRERQTDQETQSYRHVDIRSHAQNHKAAQYLEDTKMNPVGEDRYLLIFDRDKLGQNNEIMLSRELEREGIQDSVPLGAEGYVLPHDTTKLKEDTEMFTPSHENENSFVSFNDEDFSEVDEYEISPSKKKHENPEGEDFSIFTSPDNSYFTLATDLNTSDTESFINRSEDITKIEQVEGFKNFSDIETMDEKQDESPTKPYIKTDEYRDLLLDINNKKKQNKIKTRNNRKKSYRIPVHEVLETTVEEEEDDPRVTQLVGLKLEETLKEFNIESKVTSFCKGPVVTLFEILPAPGVRLSRIVSLADNIALRLAATSIRIVAPIPGKGTVGIEVPNNKRSKVGLSELVTHKSFFKQDTALPIALGRDIANNVRVSDLSRTPHLLIAGATGSGKSVCINSIICSLLFRCNPEELKFVLIDPKMVELNFYNDIPHLLTPVIDTTEKSIQALRWCVEEMERRYKVLGAYEAREIRTYNSRLIAEGMPKTAQMPYIVIVIDEFADLMLVCGKEIETLVTRIAAKSRAVGMHLVLATQRPSTDVITGLIKANIPSRIAFMVSSKTDSRIIIDQNGADALLGKGDMLFSSAQDLSMVRIQGAFLSEGEVRNVVEKVKEVGGTPEYIDEEEMFPNTTKSDESTVGDEDPLWNEVVSAVKESNRASASHLQRLFKIGYNRAARLIDEMEERGLVGPQQGGKPRDVFV